MWKLFEFIFSGCWHKWETVSTHRLTDSDCGGIGSRYILRCTKCGDVKKRDLI